MRKWLIEEIGETRQLKRGDVAWNDSRLLFWEDDLPSAANYAVVKMTEITDDPRFTIVPDYFSFDEWNW